MKRQLLAVLLTAVAAITVAGCQTASAGQTLSIRSGQSESTADVLWAWNAAGRTSGSGTWDDEDGQRLLASMRQARPALTKLRPVSYHAAGPSPHPCQGTFDNDKVSVVTLQQSPVYGIPWSMRLTPPVNAPFGVVTMNAQIFADNNRANVYAPHVEPWDYFFHGPLPRTFQRIGGGSYTMPAGSQVSFLWTWTSTSRPADGGYSLVNCTYSG